MSFWKTQMPTGMLLRSPYVASHIADPGGELTLDDYQAQNGARFSSPVPLDKFVAYGEWFQQQVAPDVNLAWIVRLERTTGGFRLQTAEGEECMSKKVVVAAGIESFASCPPQFEGLSSELVSHTCGHRDLDRFANRRVVVIGGGQSALESAALLHEAGAEVEVLVRADRIYLLRRVPRLHKLGPLTSLLFAPAEVGPAGVSRLVSAPSLYRRLPRSVQDRLAVRSLRPAGAAWLETRLRGVPITTGRAVVAAGRVDEQVEVRLGDGTTRRVDHVLLATGYRVDVAKYEFIARDVLTKLRQTNGMPRLSRSFESSVPGLYFVGAPAAWSFGPLMRFVAGTEYAAPVLANALLNGRSRRRT
jgi:cation diffusion facilitator CzcD-associated flavoprotein CzcO